MTGNVPGIGDLKVVSQRTGVSVEKLKEMKPEEIAALISSSGLTAVDNSQLPSDKSVEKAQAEVEKDSWFKRTWNKIPKGVKYGAAAVLGVGAVVVGGAAIAAGGFAAAAGVGRLGLAAVMAVGAGVTLSSCRKDNNNVYIWQNVEIALGDLAAAIQAGNEIQQQILQELINHGIKLDKIIEHLISHGQTLDDILDLLGDMNLQLGDIIHNQEELKPLVQNIQNSVSHIENLTEEQNAFLGQMIQTLMSIDQNTQLTNQQIAEIKDLMQAMFDMLAQIDEHNVQAYNEFMQQLAQNTQLLNQILDAIQTVGANNQAAFNQLIAQLLGIGGNIQDLLNAVHDNTDVLNQILTKLGSINNNIVGMQAFLNNILAELINMHGDMNTNNEQNMQLMLQLIDLVGQNNQLLQGLTAQQQAQFAQLMAQIMAIIGNQNNTNVNLETIIHLIEQNNQLIANLDNTIHNWSDQQQEQFNQLMAQIMVMIGNQNGANATLNAILNAIQDATAQGNMNAQQIIALLTNMNSTIEGWQAQQQQQFYDLMAQIMTIVGGQQNANQTLNAILNLVQQGNVNVSEILNALNNISNKLDLIQGQLQLMAEGNRAFYQAMLDSIDLTNEYQLDIIQRMINMQNSNDANATAIIQAIQGLDLSGGGLTQTQLDDILNEISNLSANLTNQVTGLAGLLTQILAKVTSIDDKVSAIQTIAGEVKTLLQTSNQLSQSILDNMGTINTVLGNIENWLINNCPDNDCCDNILVILQEILDAIINNDWNHEGYLDDDWDDYFG